MLKKFIGGVIAFALPVLAFAQGPQLGNIETLIRSIGRLINLLLPIVVALALLYFFWGLAQFILASGDDDKRKEGRQKMIWGVVTLFVMVSVWGLVSFVGSALGIQQGQSISNTPTVGNLPQ